MNMIYQQLSELINANTPTKENAAIATGISSSNTACKK